MKEDVEMSKNEIIAVSTQSLDGLNALVDPRFGRCRAFTIVTIQNGQIGNVKVIENPAIMAGGGAGIQAAQTVSDSGANAVITGNLGPNAAGALQSMGIRIYLVASGTAQSVIKDYLDGKLQQSGSANVPSHFGMGRGSGLGRGGGMGRGMGRGRGIPRQF
ncbi:MAG: NifB/NifX family molybdenum-iron cluster-binding protein [Promethearchaeota archaeon]